MKHLTLFKTCNSYSIPSDHIQNFQQLPYSRSQPEGLKCLCLETSAVKQLQEVLSLPQEHTKESSTLSFFSSALSFWCIVLWLSFNLHLGLRGRRTPWELSGPSAAGHYLAAYSNGRKSALTPKEVKCGLTDVLTYGSLSHLSINVNLFAGLIVHIKSSALNAISL